MKNRSFLVILLCIVCGYFFILSQSQKSTIETLEYKVETLQETKKELENDLDSLKDEVRNAYSYGYDNGLSDADDFDDGYESGYEDGIQDWFVSPDVVDYLYRAYSLGFESGYFATSALYDIPDFDPDAELDGYIEISWNVLMEG